jgi:histidinol phosphatase-like PHP family hydrolase
VEAGEDHEGLALIDEDARGADYLLGAVHEFHGITGKTEPMGDMEKDFMIQVRRLVANGANVLAHPFRVFQRKERPAPRDLFGPVAELLAGRGVAAEINFHTNRPEPEFFAACLAHGVRIAVGTDSHAIREVGTLEPHVALLKELGAWDRLDEVLWQPTGVTGTGRPPTGV